MMRGAKRGSPTRIPVPRARRTDARGCLSKHVYASAGEAQADILRFPIWEQPALHSYQCPDCGLIHVGHVRGVGR